MLCVPHSRRYFPGNPLLARAMPTSLAEMISWESPIGPWYACLTRRDVFLGIPYWSVLRVPHPRRCFPILAVIFLKGWNSPSAYACPHFSAMCSFCSRDRDSSQYAQVRVGFKRSNFDCDTGTDYWRTFYGSSSEASFRHYIGGKFVHSYCLRCLTRIFAVSDWVSLHKNLRTLVIMHPWRVMSLV